MNIAQSLENLRLEQDAIALYDALATIDKDPRRAAAFRHIASNERRHAEIWSARLRELGATVPPPGPPRARVRLIILAARVLGTKAVSELVKSLEGDEVEIYDAQGTNPEIESIAADEREHAEIWKRLDAGEGHEPAAAGGADGHDGTAAAGPATAGSAATARTARASEASAIVAASAHPDVPAATRAAPEQITSGEGWHRSARSGTLRAIIFGVSDGLVSNLSLVMGVAGASSQDQFILMAGIAGLLAGAFSMAAGEYISMQSQRELFERQIALERAELEAMPEDEQRELATIYAGKGVPARRRPRSSPPTCSRTRRSRSTRWCARSSGSTRTSWARRGAPRAGRSRAFAVGAAVPVLPYLVATGTAAFVVSLGLSLVALFVVGAVVSLLTGRGMIFSGLRQVGIGAAAAGRDLHRRPDHRGQRRRMSDEGGRAADARARLRAQGLDPGTWSNGPGDRYAPHEHGYDKVLVCERGSIRFGLPDAGRGRRPRTRGPARPAGRHAPRRRGGPGRRHLPRGARSRGHAGRGPPATRRELVAAAADRARGRRCAGQGTVPIAASPSSGPSSRHASTAAGTTRVSSGGERLRPARRRARRASPEAP